MPVFAQFCFVPFNMYQQHHAYITPPPCGLYRICAQNGYGQHRPCKIVLLTLVTPRGVTYQNLSWGINIEHARTAHHKTCGTEHQQPYRRWNSQTPYFNWNIAQARPLSVSGVSRSFQSSVSTTHWSYSQLTFFNKTKKNKSLLDVDITSSSSADAEIAARFVYVSLAGTSTST